MDDTQTTSQEPPEPARRWYKPWTWLTRAGNVRVLTLLALAVTIVLIMKGYKKGTAYAHKVVEKQADKIQFSFSMANPPVWMDKSTVAEIRSHIESYSNHDLPTYRRFQNPLDGDILKTVAGYYTARDFVGISGQKEDRQAVGASAWIKKVLEVRRVIRPDRAEQWIEIYAEYRKPAAVIAVPMTAGKTPQRISNFADLVDSSRVPAMKYYLVDGEQIRLPGEFAKNPNPASYMTLYGVDEDVPAPGSAWKGAEVAAGLKLAAALRSQPFASQIAMINLINFGGRAASLFTAETAPPQITLKTIHNTTVLWGRPIGTEGLYEVKPARKLNTLNEVFAKFSRIDAGREWIDIRNEDPKVKALPKTEAATKPARRPRA